MPNLLPFAPPAEVSGWFRLGKHLRWHLLATWVNNRSILVPECKRPIAVRVGAKLTSKSDLPKVALLCQGCAASRKAKEGSNA